MGDYNNSINIIKMIYGDYNNRNLNAKIRCNNRKEFLKCVDAIGSYNEFSKEVVEHILSVLDSITTDKHMRNVMQLLKHLRRKTQGGI